MKSILNKLNLLVMGTVLSLTFPGCSDDNTSDLKLDGDTWLTALELNDTYTGVIDRTNKTVTVAVPEVYDTDAMKVTGIEVSEGAEASVKAGDVLNFSFPQVIKVTNGNVFLDYTVNIKHDEARILSFKLNDAYAGVIDQTKRTITVRVPSSVNIKNMVPIITTSAGATVMPASGQAIDFSNPVEFTVSYNTASAVYTVTVIPTDAPSAVYVDNEPMLDGGIVDSIPLMRARSEGFTHNVVVLTRNHGYRKEAKDIHIPSFLYRKYPKVREALSRRCRVYNEQLEMVERMEAAGEITVIRPQKPVTVDRIERDIRKLTDLYEEGYACAAKYDFQ